MKRFAIISIIISVFLTSGYLISCKNVSDGTTSPVLTGENEAASIVIRNQTGSDRVLVFDDGLPSQLTQLYHPGETRVFISFKTVSCAGFKVVVNYNIITITNA